MGWKDLGTKERWLILTSSLQAAAAVGTFLVAVVGIWKVAPIITYQVERQAAEAEWSADLKRTSRVTDRFIQDALDWWHAQVENYQRILELTSEEAIEAKQVEFEVMEAAAGSIVPGTSPDLLVVTASDPSGTSQVIKIPVNEMAMTPTQYMQCKINQGAFAALDYDERARVEKAIQGYLYRYMLPKVPPAFVQNDMTIEELHDEIATHQRQRREAALRIRGLKAMLDVTLGEK